MKCKKIIAMAVATAFLLSFAGIASAAWEINIYGASAQYTFWGNNGTAYLTAKGCSDIAKSTGGGQTIFRANCPSGAPFGDGGVGYLRIASKASFDGCYAIKGESRSPTAGAPGRVTECDNDPSINKYHMRKMINEETCTFPGTCSSTLVCKTVTIGASDVPCECITQESHGLLKGHLPVATDNPVTDRLFNGIDMTGYDVCKPMVVTFAPFVNSAVTKGGNTITNITRDNMELIFSGQVQSWSDIADIDGQPFDAKDILVCLRHAGSGTHASLDAYLNSPLIISESQPAPWGFLFEDGSSDMQNCLNQASNPAAIGYMDADRSITGTNIKRLTLNGVGDTWPHLADANVYGTYNFYGVQHLYGNAGDLCAYLDDPTKINPPFNAECELVFTRTGSNGCDPCAAFPIGYRGARCTGTSPHNVVGGAPH